MNKKLIGWIIFAILIVIITVLIFVTQGNKKTSHPSNIASVNELTQISYEGTFNQSEDEYVVYFWQEGCSHCQSISDDVVQLNNDMEYPIYVVDMNDLENFDAWFDWDTHHEETKKVIGKITPEGDVFKEGESPEKYANDTETEWLLWIDGEDNIVAMNQSPEINEEPKDENEIKITSTPTMLKIVNGKVEEYSNGVEEVVSFIEQELD